MKKTIILITFAILCCSVFSQSVERIIQVNIAPNHIDWKYKEGENVRFAIQVTRNSIPLKDVEIRYEITEDMMRPLKEETKILKDGLLTVDAGTMKKAGFLRCRVFAKYEGNEYEGRATAAFDPEKIQPTTNVPSDFISFWDKAKAENAKIPMDVKTVLVPEKCTGKTNVYHVKVQNYKRGCYLYGILSVPKAAGKYPALLKVPGAGVRLYNADVTAGEKGLIVFEIGIHGIPVDMEVETYNNLASGALDGYWNCNLDDKDRYYYKRVYMGCVRAVDYIFSLPEFDGNNVAVQGGSQGGALAIVTAGLDNRIKCLVSFYPALCDLTGYLNGRAGGWPHLFNEANKSFNNKPDKVETSRYYDVVNFARQVKVPGFYSFGYNDMVCPPTSMFSAYNVIVAPKNLLIVEETAHFGYPEQWTKAWRFLEKNIMNHK